MEPRLFYNSTDFYSQWHEIRCLQFNYSFGLLTLLTVRPETNTGYYLLLSDAFILRRVLNVCNWSFAKSFGQICGFLKLIMHCRLGISQVVYRPTKWPSAQQSSDA